ncbi:MAG TPA: 5'/3'-nucleotidase SurE [Candidatus Udaeobacter sp.]|jgi:5'-nucleotidase|nr:5'/3'-nucleotidase SurE [Candidatus Udaeobacter sp.]
MRILISNDDGVYSPGILALAKAAKRFGEVRIVAPDVEQSSMGHAITSSRPLRFNRIHLNSFEAYRINGTPADCVALGMHRWGHVDVVLSGINLGLNLGNSCWHSGTIAAAKQAALLGSRGIAFSTNVVDGREPDFTALEPYVIRVLDLLMGLKTLSLINVNLPDKPKSIRWTRQSVRHYDGKVVADKDPAGRPIFWFTVTPLQGAAKGTDRWAIEHHWVSITPFRLDLTDERELVRALAASNSSAKAADKRPRSRRARLKNQRR